MEDIRKFLRDLEGESNVAYNDIKEIPTIGIGVNLQAPGVDEDLKKLGLQKDRILSGQQLTKDQIEFLNEQALKRTFDTFQGFKKKSFPNAQLSPNEETALMSLAYNSPKLIGPNIREFLNRGDKNAVAREILLKSNRERNPGLQRRRLEEALMFYGKDPLELLNDEELQSVSDILNNIKSQNIKKQVLQKYPKLNRFLKIKKDINK